MANLLKQKSDIFFTYEKAVKQKQYFPNLDFSAHFYQNLAKNVNIANLNFPKTLFNHNTS